VAVPDFVAQLLALLTRAASLDEPTRKQIEKDIRTLWGGRNVRISRRYPVTLEEIDARLRERKPVREIAEELESSRATIYRRLSLKSRKRTPP